MMLTDSGGIQEETTALGVPCLTLRDSTERPVTVTEGLGQVVGVADLDTESGVLVRFPFRSGFEGNLSFLLRRKDAAVLDETPMAYKDIDAVMANQADLVEVLHSLKQVVCVKG